MGKRHHKDGANELFEPLAKLFLFNEFRSYNRGHYQTNFKYKYFAAIDFLKYCKEMGIKIDRKGILRFGKIQSLVGSQKVFKLFYIMYAYFFMHYMSGNRISDFKEEVGIMEFYDE